MDNQTLATKLIAAWNRRSVAEILSLLDSEATYYDAFWGETCSGRDLVRYFDTQFAQDSIWYEQNGELLEVPNGMVVRYSAYDRQNPVRRKLIYQGAEVINVKNGKVTGISDFYCDPDPQCLVEVAMKLDRRRQHSKIAKLGLSERTTGFIKRRLTELGENTTAYLDPTLSIRQLADRIGCAISHLAHVLESEEKTTFPEYINTWRANYAAAIVSACAVEDIDMEQIASQSGFADVESFEKAFAAVFDTDILAYRARCELLTDESARGQAVDIEQTGTFHV